MDSLFSGKKEFLAEPAVFLLVRRGCVSDYLREMASTLASTPAPTRNPEWFLVEYLEKTPRCCGESRGFDAGDEYWWIDRSVGWVVLGFGVAMLLWFVLWAWRRESKYPNTQQSQEETPRIKSQKLWLRRLSALAFGLVAAVTVLAWMRIDKGATQAIDALDDLADAFSTLEDVCPDDLTYRIGAQWDTVSRRFSDGVPIVMNTMAGPVLGLILLLITAHCAVKKGNKTLQLARYVGLWLTCVLWISVSALGAVGVKVADFCVEPDKNFEDLVEERRLLKFQDPQLVLYYTTCAGQNPLSCANNTEQCSTINDYYQDLVHVASCREIFYGFGVLCAGYVVTVLVLVIFLLVNVSTCENILREKYTEVDVELAEKKPPLPSTIATTASFWLFSLADYEPLAIVGAGVFGGVVLVKRDDERLFAVKVVQRDKAERVKKLDKSVLEGLTKTGKFVAPVRCAFDSVSKLYIFMDYYAHGSLDSLLKEDPALCRDAARMIAAELCAALEHVHGACVIHNDVKPENVLVDSMGHILLADFSFATSISEPTADIPKVGFVSTPDYAAPELYLEAFATYNAAVDCWALGCVVYELCAGIPPFNVNAETKRDIVHNIIRCKWVAPAVLDDALGFIAALLNPDPASRLGFGIDFRHAWFDGFPPFAELSTLDSILRREATHLPEDDSAMRKEAELLFYDNSVEDVPSTPPTTILHFSRPPTTNVHAQAFTPTDEDEEKDNWEIELTPAAMRLLDLSPAPDSDRMLVTEEL